MINPWFELLNHGFGAFWGMVGGRSAGPTHISPPPNQSLEWGRLLAIAGKTEPQHVLRESYIISKFRMQETLTSLLPTRDKEVECRLEKLVGTPTLPLSS
jgi:hypothetical protein